MKVSVVFCALIFIASTELFEKSNPKWGLIATWMATLFKLRFTLRDSDSIDLIQTS